ncbi:flavodoxin family protein [Chloroflexota bacterium]
MKVLIVYDSLFGNTERIAQAIGSSIGGDVKVLRVGEAGTTELEELDILIVGSPTQGGRPTKAIQEFLNKVDKGAIQGRKVATFDTRYATKMVKLFGYAADRIARSLERMGGVLIAPPEAFFVEGTKNTSLKGGELERAKSWAKKVVTDKGLNQ